MAPISMDENLVQLKSAADIDKMRRAGHMLRDFRSEVVEAVRPGVSTQDLNEIFARRVEKEEVQAAFYGLYGFPGHICSSINEEVVHGIPSAARILDEGDIVSLDMGIVVDGFYSDTAVTAAVGEVDEEKQRLLKIGRESLEHGIEQCSPGMRMGDIGWAIQSHVERAGFTVVREYTGHGIGRSCHEAPKVPNFGKKGKGPRLCAGWVLAIEPMVNAGTWKTEELKDNWTVVTKDRRPSVHFEHTVAITDQGVEVLT